ncbi:enamine deaminase RidA [Pigmentiphaga sp. NML080357]|uniref:RidA family protein n=1 Tax=Pigmentiphaga sp. NML080357 TaxID=2008675 RepID=UPI000B421DBD|nr:RidA family protein [Pigmentiphaga sp. NML080357]OVZ60603.1 enamine deaminase RidA [Pigmentiphaga sp. NML080357]
MTRKQRILSPHVAEAEPGLWSNCLQVGDTLYLSGLTSRANDGTTIEGSDEYEQARIIFTKIKHLVEAAGGQIDDVVTLTVFVTRMAGNQGVWRARREFFSGDFPACALVEVKGLAKPEILVEIQGQARLGAGG